MIWENFEKSRWMVTRQWSEVTRPSADCQKTFFRRFKRFGKILKKVAEPSRDSGWGHATVGRLSNNVFWTFQAIRKKIEKSRWTVTRQWSEVTRPSADCQTTFFGRFRRFGKILKKVAERSRDSGRRSRDRRPTVKQRFLDVSSDLGKFEKSRWTVTRQWLRSRDRRPTVKQRFLDVSSDLGKFWKKSLNGHATVVGGHATVGRLSNNDFSTFQAIRNFFWKKLLNGHATVVGGHATVGRLSNNVFWTFQMIWENFEKSRWMVTRQWSEVTRPSADCQKTFFRRFKRFGKILKKVAEPSRDSGWGHATVGRLSNNVFWTFQAIRKKIEKVAERSRDSGRRSRDRRPTVKQRFLDVSGDLGKFWKKSLNGHATVVGGHATVGRLSKNVFLDVSSDLGKFWKKSLNRHATVVEVTRPSADCQTTFFGRFKQLEKKLKKVAERSRDSGRRSRDRRLTVKQRFWTFQAIRKLFVETHRRVTRQWSVVTRLSADCQAHMCMYIIINERERERERERDSERERQRERDRERERERERVRERDRIQKSSRKKLPRQFSRLLTPVPSLSVFSRESPAAADTWYYVAYVYNGELVPLMGNQRVGIFPPKSKILFVLSLALIWCRNFQDRTIPVGGDTWTSFWRKERRRRIRIKKYRVQGSCFRSNISETVRDIRVSFWLWPRGRVTLPNGATHVSVVVIVSEIL